MINEDTFVKEVLSSFNNIRQEFKEIREDINDKHKETMEEIKRLCNEYSDLKSKFTTHLKVEEELDKYKKEQGESNEKKSNRKAYLVFSLIGAVVTISNLLIVISSKI